jgi:hypothetical protein
VKDLAIAIALILAALITLAMVPVLIYYGPPSEPPFCECRGVQYRTIACVPPPGLPAPCYEHHEDIHEGRFW